MSSSTFSAAGTDSGGSSSSSTDSGSAANSSPASDQDGIASRPISSTGSTPCVLPSLLRPSDNPAPPLPVTMHCRVCHREQPLSCFAVSQAKRSNYRKKTCNRCRARRDRFGPSEGRKAALIIAAKSRPCADCGQSFPVVCMELDGVPNQLNRSWRWLAESVIKEHLERAVPLCACCDRLRDVTQRRRRITSSTLAELERVTPKDGTDVLAGRSDDPISPTHFALE